MEPIGLGIDIVELERIRELAERHGDAFVARVYTPEERARAATLRDATSFLAGRFAAKEAVLKALGTGLSGGISWQDIHVLREEGGQPFVRLSGRALERARGLGIGRLLVSISHDRDRAVAQVLGIRGDAEAITYGSEGSSAEPPGDR